MTHADQVADVAPRFGWPLDAKAAGLPRHRLGHRQPLSKSADVSQAKLFGATVGPRISVEAMELHGGYGVTTDFPIQRIHRDCARNVGAGGAAAVLRNGIAAELFADRNFCSPR
jgi:alkylation response protein AidB-like acyl-CoA dehydrogenase